MISSFEETVNLVFFFFLHNRKLSSGKEYLPFISWNLNSNGAHFIFYIFSPFKLGPFYISDTCVIKCSVTWRPPTFNTSVASWNCRCYHFEIIVKLSRNCGDDVDDDDDDVGCDDDDETDVHWALFAQRPPSLARLLRKPTRALLAIVEVIAVMMMTLKDIF